MIETIVIPILSVLLGGGVVYFFTQGKGKEKPKSEIKNTSTLAPDKDKSIQNAQSKARQILLDAKDQAIQIKASAERTIQEERRRLKNLERGTRQKQTEFTSKKRRLETQEHEINSLKDTLRKKRDEIEKIRLEQVKKLGTVASLTKEEAKKLILSNIERSLSNEIAKRIKEAEEKFKAEADEKAKELLVDAMHHAATDYVAEYTISKVKLPDPDIKGRIIGKDGRNIKSFEDATGVTVDLEEGDEIRLSSFDSVRREIARISLEKLIKDGRIQPARIEEIVRKTKEEMDRIIFKAGEELCTKVGVYNLPTDLIKKLGHFKYRTSYGQNMVQHTLEETKIGVKLAKEIGADVATTKLACLLHDIGKVVTDKEGNHIELGAEYLKKFNLPKAVIKAVEEHHNDKPSTIPGVLVQIADSISGSRPGARYEDYSSYITRLKKLEETAMSFDGVEKAFAISAGRELRVIVNPDNIDDSKAVKLSHDLAKKIQEEQTYPGTVKIIIIRETRSVSTAT